MRSRRVRQTSIRAVSAWLARAGLGAAALISAGLSSGCSSDSSTPADPEPPASTWQIVEPSLDAALLSVWGTRADDVWSAGADVGDGSGPLVLHFDGGSWTRQETGAAGDLWWAHGFESGPVYFGGAGGVILRWQGGVFTPMSTPGTGTVFGIWGDNPGDVWAVGGSPGGAQGAFAWRLERGEGGADQWLPAPGFPPDLARSDALWKVYGHGAEDVWMVGTGGKVLHWDGRSLTPSFTGEAESLFTVHANSTHFAAVGGFVSGLLLEREISAPADAPWLDASPEGAQGLVGVCLTEAGGYAVGQYGYIAQRDADGWHEEDTGLMLEFGTRSLHSVWVDPEGGAWAVGGNVLVEPLVEGILLHKPAP